VIVAVSEAVSVCEAVSACETDRVIEAVAVRLDVWVTLAVDETDNVCVCDAVTDVLGDPVWLEVCETLGEVVSVGVLEAVSVCDWVSEGVNDCVWLGVRVDVCDELRVPLEVSSPDAV
jgi:hypothetical protein